MLSSRPPSAELMYTVACRGIIIYSHERERERKKKGGVLSSPPFPRFIKSVSISIYVNR